MKPIYHKCPDCGCEWEAYNSTFKALDALLYAIRHFSDKDAVAMGIFINGKGREVSIKYKSAEELKTAGISMRNLRGEFIK
jgi:hypothetical protein